MIWWRTCVFDILVENRILESTQNSIDQSSLSSWCQRGAMLLSVSWEKLNSVNRSLSMAQGRVWLCCPQRLTGLNVPPVFPWANCVSHTKNSLGRGFLDPPTERSREEHLLVLLNVFDAIFQIPQSFRWVIPGKKTTVRDPIMFPS